MDWIKNSDYLGRLLDADSCFVLIPYQLSDHLLADKMRRSTYARLPPRSINH